MGPALELMEKMEKVAILLGDTTEVEAIVHLSKAAILVRERLLELT